MSKGHSKQKKSIGVLIFIAIVILAIILLSQNCNRCYNSVKDPHFNCDGTLIVDSTDIPFRATMPVKIKFFVEVSGSMNGFFRTNMLTDFKNDVYGIMSYYEKYISDILSLTGDGSSRKSYSLNDFNEKMKKGDFESSDWTQMPIMIKNITENIDVRNGEVAILISDMVYSPGGKAAAVSVGQYQTDISKVLGNFGYSICLIGATSDFLDKMGHKIVDASPYYFLILGAPETVAELRNGISTLLDNNGHFIDNIETGFTYGTRPSFSFGIPENCSQLNNEPTFIGFKPPRFSCTRNTDYDTAVIKLKVNLENYRWRIADEDVFRDAFKCKAIYGSEVKVGDVVIETQNIVKTKLNRTAIATVELKLCHMPQDADVIEWTLELPDLDVTKYTPYLGATSENDRCRTYSLENFLKGMFYGGVVNDSLKPNYILVSKKL